jgi:hypothetical protein
MFSWTEVADICVSLNSGPVPLKDSSSPGVEFALPSALEPGSLKPEVKSSDP